MKRKQCVGCEHLFKYPFAVGRDKKAYPASMCLRNITQTTEEDDKFITMITHGAVSIESIYKCEMGNRGKGGRDTNAFSCPHEDYSFVSKRVRKPKQVEALSTQLARVGSSMKTSSFGGPRGVGEEVKQS